MDAGVLASDNDQKALKPTRYGAMRLAMLTGAFFLILINPFVNRYFQINFVQGWYQSLGIGDLWFVSPLEGLESLLIAKTFYLPSLVGMAIPVLLALMLGRVFCSWICPVSFFLELIERLRRRLQRKRHLFNGLVIARRVLWFTLIGELILSMIVGGPLFVFLSPPGLIGRELMMFAFFGKFAIEGGLLFIVLALEFVTRRCFCRSFCPLGALLALLGRRRKLQVQADQGNCTACSACNRACPMGLLPADGEGVGPYCWNCGECVDSCRHDALHFRWS